MRTMRSMTAGGFAIAFVAAAVAPSPSAGQPIRLTPADAPAHASANGLLLSPNGEVAVISIDLGPDGEPAYYAAPTRGGDLVRISRFHPDGTTGSNAFSADGRIFVHREAEAPGEPFRLICVPTIGPAEAATDLYPAVGATASIGEWAIAPDGARIVFVVIARDAGGDAVGARLWSAPCGGGATPLTPEDPPDWQNMQFAISSDSSWVVVSGRLEFADRTELWRIPIAGGAATRLSPPMAAGGAIFSLTEGFHAIQPGGPRVFYYARTASGAPYRLYTSRLDTLARTLLSEGLDIGQPGRMRLSPGGALIAFRADLPALPTGLFELYANRVSGGTFARLSPPVAFDGVEDDFAFTPDLQHVVFRADLPDSAFASPRLFSASPFGGDAVRLDLLADGPGAVERFAVSPAGTHVAFVAGSWVPERFEAFAAPIAGPAGTAFRVSPPASETTRVNPRWIALGHHGRNVLWNGDVGEGFRGYFARIADGGGIPGEPAWNDPEAEIFESYLGDELHLHPDGRRLFWSRVGAASTLLEYPLSPPDPLAAIDLEPPEMLPAGGVEQARLSPNGHALIFLADLHGDGRASAWSLYFHALFADDFESGDIESWDTAGT
jgi:hypothetical protein